MFELIESIKEGAKLRLPGRKREYTVLSKALYVTEKETGEWYARIQIEWNLVLVIYPFQDYMYFGYNGEEAMDDFYLEPDEFEYEGNIYNKCAKDYQIVKKIVFGDYELAEGETSFLDYRCGDKVISLRIVWKTGKRRDVYGEIIKPKDIQVVNNS